MTTNNGLPMVEGLEAFLREDAGLDIADKGQIEAPEPQPEQIAEQQVATDDGQAPSEMSDEEILAQFKSTKNLLKSYKEIQGFTTRVSQENKEKAKVIEELQSRLNQLQEEAELRKYQTPQAPHQPTTQKSFEEQFIENPELAIQTAAMRMANVQRINDVLEEKRGENPDEWQERIAYVHMLSKEPQYQPLAESPAGVRKLFEIADKTRVQALEKTTRKTLNILFGEDYDLEKLKALIRRDGGTIPTGTTKPTTANPLTAYMPDTGTSYRTGADVNLNVNDLERRKQEAIASGDADTVAGAIIRQALLK
jgi:hypothetical protein